MDVSQRLSLRRSGTEKGGYPIKRTLSLVLAVLMVLALFGAAAEDTKKVEIRVNMQAGTGVAEA